MPKTTVSSTRTTTLYLRFGPLIFSRCLRRLGDESLAAEATAEVFVHVVGRLETGSPASALEALARACERVCGELQSSSA